VELLDMHLFSCCGGCGGLTRLYKYFLYLLFFVGDFDLVSSIREFLCQLAVNVDRLAVFPLLVANSSKDNDYNHTDDSDGGTLLLLLCQLNAIFGGAGRFSAESLVSLADFHAINNIVAVHLRGVVVGVDPGSVCIVLAPESVVVFLQFLRGC
jgi:hypothetical protein